MRLRRITDVIQILTEEGLGFLVARVPRASASSDTPSDAGEAEVPPEARKDVELARRLRRAFERLGPTFVKFGQIMATRGDVFSEEFCAELGKLQSHAAPIEFRVVEQVIEAELRNKLDAVFASFERQPLASASVAQVHAATLADGRAVVVKVQRPEAKEQMLADLDLLLTLSGWLDKIFSPYRRTMVHRLVEEQRRISLQELDFRVEAATTRRMAALHRDEAWVKIPDVYEDLSTERLIVSERLFGHRLDTVRTVDELRRLGLEPETLAKRMLTMVFRQALAFGLLHAGMHPGNLFVMDGGRIGVIDFGMHMEVPKEIRDSLLRLIRLRAARRFDEAADVVLNELCRKTSHTDAEAFKRDYVAYCKAHDLADGGHSYGRGLIEESRLGSRYELMSPPELIAIARALLVVDGVVLRFCPGFSFIDAGQDIIGGIMRERLSLPRLVDQLWEVMPDLIEAVERNPEFNRGLLRLRHAFGSSRNLREFLEREGFAWAGRSSETAVTRLLVAFALGAVSAAAIIMALR